MANLAQKVKAIEETFRAYSDSECFCGFGFNPDNLSKGTRVKAPVADVKGMLYTQTLSQNLAWFTWDQFMTELKILATSPKVKKKINLIYNAINERS